jgi:cobalt transporter subunit CbtA
MMQPMTFVTPQASPATKAGLHSLMIQRMLASALIAGFAAGLLAALLHFAFVQEYILLGEQYESGEIVHFKDAVSMTEGHAHEGAAAEGHATPEGHAAHDHGAGGMVSDLQRNGLTVLFAGLIYVAYGLILVAGFGVAESFGLTITPREGLMWGIAGFVSFQLAPALGLAPELPGTIAADLTQRQIWWWGTVLATATSLGLFAYGKGYVTMGLGVLLLAAPHIIGAPVPDTYWGVAPPEVGAIFAARVLGTALVVWAVLGWLAAKLWAEKAA